MFTLILKQTLTHAFRKGGGAFGTAAFYIIVVTLFTFGLGPEGMAQYAGAVMACAMLLSSVVALPLMYERDHEDGSLEQYVLQPMPLELLALAKILGQWLAVIAPILTVSPVMALFANLSPERTGDIMIMLTLASPTMTAIGSVAAALTIGTRRGGLLQALIVLPLYTPLLIFAASTGENSAALLLTGILCAAIPLGSYVSAALVRISQD